jgi:hypothetical protein
MVGRNSFRTAVSIGVERRHRWNPELFAYCSPRKTFFVSEPDDFITAEDAFRPAHDLPRSLSGLDAGQRSLANYLALEFGNAGEDLKKKTAGRILLVSCPTTEWSR